MENAYYEQVFENWSKLQNVWQKSSKHSYEILWVNFIKLFNDLVAFTNLHRTYCFTLPTFMAKCQWFCGQKYPKVSSFFWFFLCRNSSLTKATDSCFFLLKKYLTVVNLSHVSYIISQPFYHVYLLLAKKLVSQKQAAAFEENFIASPHQVT